MPQPEQIPPIDLFFARNMLHAQAAVQANFDVSGAADTKRLSGA